ncbi:MAG: serine--tRNA ligase [Hyphomicrobiaceae bacterium]|nr:serine--tRNA ligase [Hyphomicrobiaceae bacterium]
MYDINWIREDPDGFDAALAKRGLEPLATEVLKIDEERRAIVQKLQDAQAMRNASSKEIGKAKASGDEATAQKLMEEVAQAKTVIQTGEEDQRRVDATLKDMLSGLPNAPLDDVPEGEDEKDNVEVRAWGEKPSFAFEPKQHFELGEALGLMDFETAAKLSGARFVVLRGALARLERAIASFMLDIHTSEFGYQETLPPALVRDHVLYGTGQLPKFADDLFATGKQSDQDKDYYTLALDKLTNQLDTDPGAQMIAAEAAQMRNTDQDYLWLIPTAEVPLTNMVREAIVEEDDLPKRMTAWTPCFRAEAGAAGKDTRGMIRQHQFSKVELVSITTEGQALDEHERMTNCAEEILKRLELPYRTVVLCTGDMGFGARKTYDIEVWLPGQDTYREISSCSVCGDFQARRMNARYRVKGEKELRFVHTLNGSGLAIGRTMIAIMENNQQEDGSILIPEALRPYMGGLEKIASA